MQTPTIRRLNVTTRVTLWNVTVLALAMLVMGAVVRLSVEQNLTASVDRELQLRIRRVSRDRSRPRTNSNQGAETTGNVKSRLSAGSAPSGNRFAPSSRTRNSQASNTLQPGAALRETNPVDVATGSATNSASTAPDTRRSAPAATFAGPNSRWRSRVFDLHGKPLYGENELPWDRSTLATAASTGHEVFSTTQADGETVRVLSVPFQRRNERGVVQGAYSMADVERALAKLNDTLLALIPVALLAAWFGGAFLTGRMIEPLRAVTSAASGISAADLSQRLPVTGEDEFSVLAITFNEMLGRLDRAFDQQRRFVADASHELRTPLTVIKANTSLVLGQSNLSARQKLSLQAVDNAAGLMAAVVQDLLLLARSDAGQFDLCRRTTPVYEVIEGAVACAQRDGAARIVNTVMASDNANRATAADRLTVEGDSAHLTRLFVNLLDNALLHTPSDGSVTITATPSPDGFVDIAIADTGVGIAPEHLPFVCDRFYRSDASRTRAHGGTGLGLAICQTIAATHGGSLRIESILGSGTTVHVRIPSKKL